MIYSNKLKLLSYRLLTWNSHIKNVVGLNMFAVAQISTHLGQGFKLKGTWSCQISKPTCFKLMWNSSWWGRLVKFQNLSVIGKILALVSMANLTGSWIPWITKSTATVRNTLVSVMETSCSNNDLLVLEIQITMHKSWNYVSS